MNTYTRNDNKEWCVASANTNLANRTISVHRRNRGTVRVAVTTKCGLHRDGRTLYRLRPMERRPTFTIAL